MNAKQLNKIFARAMYGMVIAAMVFSTVGSVNAQTPSPFIWADPLHDAINGWDWNEGDNLVLHVYDQDNNGLELQDPNRTYTSENGASYDMRAEGIDIQEGYRITLDNGDVAKELIVSPLEVTDINLCARSISGMYDPSLDFWINVEGMNPGNLSVENDQWIATFPDIYAEAGGEVAQPDNDGDMTGIGFYVPRPWLVAYPENDVVEGWEWPNGVEIKLTIGAWEWTGEAAVTNWGDSRTYVRFDLWEDGYDLQTNDTLTLTSNGCEPISYTVRPLSITNVDMNTDTVSGTADVGAQLQVWAHDQSEPPVDATSGDGTWQANLSNVYDITFGSAGLAWVIDGANATAVDWNAPGPVFVFPDFQDEVFVTSEDEIILGVGWGACTPGLVTAWLHAADYHWYMDGNPIMSSEQAANYWSSIESRGPNPACLIGAGELWVASWRYSIGSLSVGDYEISLIYGTDHKLTDGSDFDGDGQLDFYQHLEANVTIHVIGP